MLWTGHSFSAYFLGQGNGLLCSLMSLEAAVPLRRLDTVDKPSLHFCSFVHIELASFVGNQNAEGAIAIYGAGYD